MNTNHKLKLKWWWYITPTYLTLWTLVFSIWNLVDGVGMFQAFKVDIGSPAEFIMINSAARYFAIGIGMALGIFVFRTFSSILTALAVRFTMDILDLYAGLKTGLILDASGVIQSFLMFLLPCLLAIFLLIGRKAIVEVKA